MTQDEEILKLQRQLQSCEDAVVEAQIMRDDFGIALREVMDALDAIDRPWELEGHGFTPRRAEEICALLDKVKL